MGTGSRSGNPAKNGGKNGGPDKAGGPAARAKRPSERRQQVEAMRRAQARRDRIRVSALITGTALLVVAVIVLAIVFSGGSGSGGSKNAGGTTSDQSASLLATTAGQVKGQAVDGITCDTGEGSVTHIHAHLAVYVDGKARTIPYGIGIVGPYTLDQSGGSPFVGSGTCFYWLHTHDETGVLHIESPSPNRTFTLGNVFDEWRQPLSATQVGPARGKVTAVVNGKPFTGDPATLRLDAHDVIQISVGPVVPFKNYTFASGL